MDLSLASRKWHELTVDKIDGSTYILEGWCEQVVSCGNHKVINPIVLEKEGALLISTYLVY